MKNQYQIEDKIIFIKRHLESLDHFLPETYEYLMEELDYQEKELMKIKIKLFDSEQSKWIISAEKIQITPKWCLYELL